MAEVRPTDEAPKFDEATAPKASPSQFVLRHSASLEPGECLVIEEETVVQRDFCRQSFEEDFVGEPGRYQLNLVGGRWEGSINPGNCCDGTDLGEFRRRGYCFDNARYTICFRPGPESYDPEDRDQMIKIWGPDGN